MIVVIHLHIKSFVESHCFSCAISMLAKPQELHYVYNYGLKNGTTWLALIILMSVKF